MLLLDRDATASNILYLYFLIAMQLSRIYCTIIAWSRFEYSMLLLNRDATYCTIIAWSRFDYSMLLLNRDATASNILYLLLLLDRVSIILCYYIIVMQLLWIYCTIIAWSRFDYSMLLSNHASIIVCYCLIAM
jgi:hypothetical protein